MKTLLVRPLEHPLILDIEDNLENYYKLINCELIECLYPFNDNAILICDDCGAISGKQMPNRKVGQNIIFGPFIILSLKGDNFDSLSDEQLMEYYDKFYYPEIILPKDGDYLVFKLTEGELSI